MKLWAYGDHDNEVTLNIWLHLQNVHLLHVFIHTEHTQMFYNII